MIRFSVYFSDIYLMWMLSSNQHRVWNTLQLSFSQPWSYGNKYKYPALLCKSSDSFAPSNGSICLQVFPPSLYVQLFFFTPLLAPHEYLFVKQFKSNKHLHWLQTKLKTNINQISKWLNLLLWHTCAYHEPKSLHKIGKVTHVGESMLISRSS